LKGTGFMIRGINKVCIFAGALWLFTIVPTVAWSHGGIDRIRTTLSFFQAGDVNTLDHARDAYLGLPDEAFMMARRGRGGRPIGEFGGGLDEDGGAWTQRYRQWESLPPEKKRLLRERMKQWKRLSPKEKKLIRKRYEQWKSLSHEEQIWIQHQLRRWKELSPKEREMIRQMFMH